jgi:general secretion pathway protein I
MRLSRGRRGFTLLEVMVALAIFAVAAIALTRAGISYSQAVSGLRDRTHAHWVLMNEVAQLRIQQTWPEGSADQDVMWGEQQWRIHRQVYPTPVADVRRVELSVFMTTNSVTESKDAPIQRMIVFLRQPQGD